MPFSRYGCPWSASPILPLSARLPYTSGAASPCRNNRHWPFSAATRSGAARSTRCRGGDPRCAGSQVGQSGRVTIRPDLILRQSGRRQHRRGQVRSSRTSPSSGSAPVRELLGPLCAAEGSPRSSIRPMCGRRDARLTTSPRRWGRWRLRSQVGAVWEAET